MCGLRPRLPFLQPFCPFNVAGTRLSLALLAAIREKCLDKVVDTLMEEPANQRDEEEETENEDHQIRRWRSHFEKSEEKYRLTKYLILSDFFPFLICAVGRLRIRDIAWCAICRTKCFGSFVGE